MAKKKTAKKTSKKKPAKKAKTKAKPRPKPTPTHGRLVSEERKANCLRQLYESSKGVTLVEHYEGARIAAEGAPTLGKQSLPVFPKVKCTNCRGTKTKALKSFKTLSAWRCLECVDPKSMKPFKFYMPRKREPEIP